MCITIFNNKIRVNDYDIDEHSEINEDPTITLLDWVSETSNIKEFNEYPESWKDRITKHEYCTIIKEQVDSVLDAKTKGDKQALKNNLLCLIKASVLAFNHIKDTK